MISETEEIETINTKIFYLKKEYIQLMIDTDKIDKTTVSMTHVEVPSTMKINNKCPNTDVLEWIFFVYNDDSKNPLVTKENQAFIKNSGLHTSMSTGDIIEINGDMYVCKNIGWRKL